jgi:hypothetical protein
VGINYFGFNQLKILLKAKSRNITITIIATIFDVFFIHLIICFLNWLRSPTFRWLELRKLSVFNKNLCETILINHTLYKNSCCEVLIIARSFYILNISIRAIRKSLILRIES